MDWAKEGYSIPPAQQTSAIAFPSLMQVSAVGQQNDPRLHFVVLAGQFVADSAHPPAVDMICVSSELRKMSILEV